MVQKLGGGVEDTRGFDSVAEACCEDIIIMTETPSELALYEAGKKCRDAHFNNIVWSYEQPVS
ncbi:uncharacterized protein ColSpa_11921 [Colletotrichum spaethianum]|uniref:Uncharacterized protein n=1 Tax=Colletotrichum spaethianum TaxID=700344 RepID=A0AA37PG85_9PEZI|nr:uncharacterized protein ColSpa_11921 [Colletotrichum spaethianum]GKT51740.1 hypothetical protein ColSpa_11921 [Colletotrichum spaethianum]